MKYYILFLVLISCLNIVYSIPCEQIYPDYIIKANTSVSLYIDTQYWTCGSSRTSDGTYSIDQKISCEILLTNYQLFTVEITANCNNNQHTIDNNIIYSTSDGETCGNDFNTQYTNINMNVQINKSTKIKISYPKDPISITNSIYIQGNQYANITSDDGNTIYSFLTAGGSTEECIWCVGGTPYFSSINMIYSPLCKSTISLTTIPLTTTIPTSITTMPPSTTIPSSTTMLPTTTMPSTSINILTTTTSSIIDPDISKKCIRGTGGNGCYANTTQTGCAPQDVSEYILYLNNITLNQAGGPSDQMAFVVQAYPNPEIMLSDTVGIPGNSPHYDGQYTFDDDATITLNEVACKLTTGQSVPTGRYKPQGKRIAGSGCDSIFEPVSLKQIPYGQQTCCCKFRAGVIYGDTTWTGPSGGGFDYCGVISTTIPISPITEPTVVTNPTTTTLTIIESTTTITEPTIIITEPTVIITEPTTIITEPTTITTTTNIPTTITSIISSSTMLLTTTSTISTTSTLSSDDKYTYYESIIFIIFIVGCICIIILGVIICSLIICLIIWLIIICVKYYNKSNMNYILIPSNERDSLDEI
jgi:hypothetical protein